MALYCSIALTAFGLRSGPANPVRRLASSISATTPDVTPAAMLVPLSSRNCLPLCDFTRSFESRFARNELENESDASRLPGATTSGFANPSYHVGPRELYGATTSSSRTIVLKVDAAPTVMADGALPGDVTPP